MRPPESNRHPAHAAGDRVPPYWPVMQQFHGNAFVKPELAQAPRLMFRELIPIDGDDLCRLSQR